MNAANIIAHDNSRTDDDDPQNAEGETGTAIRRVRLKSPRKQLQITIQRMEKLCQRDDLKPAKLADLLLSMGDLQKMLLKLTTDEETEKLTEEHAALRGQHDADTKRIATLEAENARARNHQCEVKTVTVTDPEHVALRAERDLLREAFHVTVAQIDKREYAAIAVLRAATPAVGRIVCQALGVNYDKYSRWIQMSEHDITRVVELADPESEADYVTFCRAALNASIKTRARARSQPEEPAIRTVEEARQWAKQRSAVSSCNAMPRVIDSREF